jgi:DNA-binding NarL/FixJ family response regulator
LPNAAVLSKLDLASTMKFLIVDDHPLFREALKGTLAGGLKDARIAAAGSFEAAVAALAADGACDLILLDLKMPGVQGLSGLVYLRAQHPSVPVVIVSASEEQDIMRRAVDLGAAGFIPKSSSVDTIVAAVSAILEGGVWMPPGFEAEGGGDAETDTFAKKLAALSAQQIRVLMFLRAGLLNKQIAYELGVSEATIKSHVSAILLKLNVASRTQAVIAASRIDGQAARS